MISPQELRIGNWVELDGAYCQVTGIRQGEDKRKLDPSLHAHTGKIYFLSTGKTYRYIGHFRPIPLTEEILLKCGFEKKVTRTDHFDVEMIHYEKDRHYVYLISDGFEFEYETGHGRVNLFRTLHYIHQLQNLFFIFTGRELDIKL